MLQEAIKRRPFDPVWERRNIDLHASASATIGRLRPPPLKRAAARRIESPWIDDTAADPPGHRYAHGVPDGEPPGCFASHRLGRLRPVDGKALKALSVADVRRHDIPVGEDDRRCRAQADGGSTLESGYRVSHQTEAVPALGPVKAVRRSGEIRRILGRLRFIGEKNVTWIRAFTCRKHDHALSPLRNERSCIDHTIGPAITPFLEGLYQPRDCFSSPQLQHEGDVFEQDRWWPGLVDQAKYVGNESGTLALDPGLLAGSREILAGKAGAEEVGPRYRGEGGDVIVERYARKPRLQDGSRRGGLLAEKLNLDPGPREAQVEAANSGKEGDSLQGEARRSVSMQKRSDEPRIVTTILVAELRRMRG